MQAGSHAEPDETCEEIAITPLPVHKACHKEAGERGASEHRRDRSRDQLREFPGSSRYVVGPSDSQKDPAPRDDKGEHVVDRDRVPLDECFKRPILLAFDPLMGYTPFGFIASVFVSRKT